MPSIDSASDLTDSSGEDFDWPDVNKELEILDRLATFPVDSGDVPNLSECVESPNTQPSVGVTTSVYTFGNSKATKDLIAYRTAFPSGHRRISVLNGGHCGLHAIIASFHSQHPDLATKGKAPNLDGLLAVLDQSTDTVNRIRKSLRLLRMVNDGRSWLPGDQLAAIFHLFGKANDFDTALAVYTDESNVEIHDSDTLGPESVVVWINHDGRKRYTGMEANIFPHEIDGDAFSASPTRQEVTRPEATSPNSLSAAGVQAEEVEEEDDASDWISVTAAGDSPVAEAWEARVKTPLQAPSESSQSSLPGTQPSRCSSISSTGNVQTTSRGIRRHMDVISWIDAAARVNGAAILELEDELAQLEGEVALSHKYAKPSGPGDIGW